MRTSTRAAGLRTSDAERQRVAEFLRDACADGRLSADELDERLDALFASTTVADLERLVWDLPGGGAVLPRLGYRPRAAVPARRPPPRRRVAPAVVFGGVAALWAIVALALPPLFAVLGIVAVVALFAAVLTLVAALAPVGLFLFGLAWLVSRLFRGRGIPDMRRYHGHHRHRFR
jgi:hypothetical protein